VHQFGNTEPFIDCLPRRMRPIAEQLLGREVVRPVVGVPINCANWGTERGGGLHGAGMYGTMPMVEGDNAEQGEQRRCETNAVGAPKLNNHVDGLACNLGCVGYIDDVPPDGGGFAIYPGSHRRMHHCFNHAYSVTKNERYAEVARRCQLFQKPMVFEGQCGDVIIYHHRMFHSATQNFSSRIRLALFYDFVAKDLRVSDRRARHSDN
jgi:hypothetical protein